MEQYEDAKQEFRENCSHEKYLDRVEKFLDREREWVKLFRSETLNRGHNTNNFSEATIRVFKDNVMNRTKSYNCCALADTIATSYEDNLKRRLLHYAYDREKKPKLMYDRLRKKMPQGKAKRRNYTRNTLNH